MTEGKTDQRQDWRDQDGRYAYSDMDRMCVCGHRLGIHSAEAPRCCFACDFTADDCDCEKFRPKRSKGKWVYQTEDGVQHLKASTR